MVEVRFLVVGIPVIVFGAVIKSCCLYLLYGTCLFLPVDADSESAGEDRRASTALENEQQASIVEVEDASGPPQSFSISEEDTPMVESSASIRDTTSAEPTNDIKFDITSPDNEDASMEGTDSDFSAATDIGRDSSAAASNAVAEVSESESSSSDNSSEEGEVAESDVEMAGDVTGNADAANEDEDSDEAMDESDDSDSSEQPTSTTQGIPLTSQAASMSPDIPVAPPSPLAAPPAASAAVEPSFAPVSSSTLNAPSTTQQHSPNPPSTNQYKAKYFTPYQSPLRQFHAYRFHPNFNKEVPGGYKSLTYAHNIRPNDELCRFETAGGVCNDRTCMMQHFREIAMTGASSPPESTEPVPVASSPLFLFQSGGALAPFPGGTQKAADAEKEEEEELANY